jgi:hypothetical protein
MTLLEVRKQHGGVALRLALRCDWRCAATGVALEDVEAFVPFQVSF